MIALATAGLRARRGRTVLAALGILAASLVVGVAATVGYGLATGFSRSADAASLPDVIARFSPEPRARIDARVRALPNLAARSYRYEANNVALESRGRLITSGAVHVVLGGRRGYDVVAGRDLSGRRGEVVIEQGLADTWHLRPGDRLEVGDGVGGLRIVGIAVSPDNVAYPLAKAARVYVSESQTGPVPADVALLWLHDPSKVDVTLTQARAVSFGIGRLEVLTRHGVQLLLSQAAGIVISLLVAFSLVALAAAGTMLAAGAHADVQRRLPAFGMQRAIGFPPSRIAAVQATEALLVAVPAAIAGLAAGALAVSGPASTLLATLNELPPGAALLAPLAVALVVSVLVVTAAATWPAYRAAARPPAEILRGGDLATRRRLRTRGGSGFVALGARFATAARGRWVAAIATIAVCAGVVTLMLALASLLEQLRDDPGTIGRRYSLVTDGGPRELPKVRAVPGVAAAGVRYQVDAADSFRLGESVRLIAYPGDHTRFEAPPLASGRRLRGPGEAEVGEGLADALGLRPGATLAVQLPGGPEVRFRVVGVVRALDVGGRIAWVQPRRLLAGLPGLSPTLAIRLTPGADRAAVARRLAAAGMPARSAAGASTRNGRFLGVLAAVLRGVGLAVGLVCLYALVQALAMTARERRGAVALLRATGAGTGSVALVLGGAALAVALPGALAGLVLEAAVLGPLVGHLAAGFADIQVTPTVAQAALVAAALAVLAAAATAVVARRVMREPVVAGLREG